MIIMKRNDLFMLRKKSILLRCLTFIRGDIKGKMPFFKNEIDSSRSFLPKTDLIDQIEEKGGNHEPVLFEPSDISLSANIEYLTTNKFFKRLRDIEVNCSLRIFPGSKIFKIIDQGLSLLKKNGNVLYSSQTALGLAHSRKRDQHSYGEKVSDLFIY